MHDQPRRTLRQLIERFGAELIDDPRRTRALLNDFCGEHRREIAALVDAQEQGIPAALLEPAAWLPAEAQRKRLAQKLLDNLPFSQEAAHWAVDAWAEALGVAAPPPGRVQRMVAAGTRAVSSAFQGAKAQPAPSAAPPSAAPPSATSPAAPRAQTPPAQTAPSQPPRAAAPAAYSMPASRQGAAPHTARPVAPRPAAAPAAVPAAALPPANQAAPRVQPAPRRARRDSGRGLALRLLAAVAAVAAGVWLGVTWWSGRSAGTPAALPGAVQTAPSPAQPVAGGDSPETILLRAYPPPQQAQVVAGPVNLRAGPALDQEILSTLADGQTVRVVAYSADGDWARIDEPVSGWVSNGYLLYRHRPPAQSPDAGQQGEIEVQLLAGDAAVAAAALTLYSGPGEHYPPVGELAQGEAVTLAAATPGYEWRQLVAPAPGWVRAGELRFEPPAGP